MKKSVLLMAAATAIALSSCSSEETKDIAKSSSSITFRSAVGLNSRGAEVTTENLKNIWVSAWTDADNVFTDELFVKKDGTTEFHCDKDEPYYWEKNKNYTFVSFATGKADKGGLTPTVDKTGITLNDYAPDKDPANHMDLLAAQATGNITDNGTTGVPLTFEHILSQIQVKVKSENEDVKYVIRGVRISNVSGTGNYTYSPNGVNKHSWTVNTAAQYISDKGIDIRLDGTDKTAKDLLAGNLSAMLLPQNVTAWDGIVPAGPDATFAQVNGSYISLLIHIQKKAKNGQWVQVYPKEAANDTQCGWTAVAIPALKWENGKKYIYTLDLTFGAGVVDPVQPNPDGSTVVKPGDKDPDMGGEILGKEIYFKVDVKTWEPTEQNVPM
jgi:hypothetical protein